MNKATSGRSALPIYPVIERLVWAARFDSQLLPTELLVALTPLPSVGLVS